MVEAGGRRKDDKWIDGRAVAPGTSGTRGEPQLVVRATIVWFVESDRMFRNNEMGADQRWGMLVG